MNRENLTCFDIIIVGGGMVGATLAVALARTGQFSVAVIEAFPLVPAKKNGEAKSLKKSLVFTPSYDARSTALSEGSCQILANLELLDHVKERAAPITDIHVSDQGRFGVTRISCKDEKVDSFGMVVENPWFGRALINAMQEYDAITLFSPAKVVAIDINQQREKEVNVLLEEGGSTLTLEANLLVAADGADSSCCEFLHIAREIHDYEQSAIIANLTPVKPHENIAYERFTATGPMALLPLVDNRLALVFTVSSEDLNLYLSMSDEDFMEEVNHRFGGRTGGFKKVGGRASYPLRLMRAKEQIRPSCVIVGNAAHSLHPVAGQGLNLSLRDVAILTKTLSEAEKNNISIGKMSMLEEYWRARELDQETTIQFSDKLMRLFSNDSLLLATGRNLGMVALDLWPSGKKILTRHSMGLAAGVSEIK